MFISPWGPCYSRALYAYAQAEVMATALQREGRWDGLTLESAKLGKGGFGGNVASFKGHCGELIGFLLQVFSRVMGSCF